MRLKQLIKIIDPDQADSIIEDFEVKGISCDSKKILDNFIFVAIKGSKEDGHKFIKEAIDRGAKAVILQSPVARVTQPPEKVPFIKVIDSRRALAKLATEFYGKPSAKIKVVGITGTNGKTTISYLIEALLKATGKNPAVIGTVNYRFKDKIIPAKNTTPGPLELQDMFASMLKEDIDYAIMEVSSHALDQDRTEGIDFHSAIFTNLTQDHLDYHHTIENYFQAKLKLFKNMNSGAFAIINNDDEYSRRIKELTKIRIITYAVTNPAHIAAKDIKLNLSGTEFNLKSPQGQINFKTKLIGMHNIYNVLASVSWALNIGLELPAIKLALEGFESVPGRLERINFKGNFSVFVDYAHTEDALMNVINSLRKVSNGRIIVMFGCGGERDRTKRPKMGRVVSELADYAVITNDNPRSEDPQEIINDIKNGIKKYNYCVIPERKEAIKEALAQARTGDIVLLAGKGHENYQILKDKTIHFDDREVAGDCLSAMNY